MCAKPKLSSRTGKYTSSIVREVQELEDGCKTECNIREDTHSQKTSLNPIHPLYIHLGFCYQISRRCVNDIPCSLKKA